jgi:hypothetical protein
VVLFDSNGVSEFQEVLFFYFNQIDLNSLQHNSHTMHIKEVEQALQKAIAIKASHPTYILLFRTIKESNEASRALYQLFGNDDLAFLFKYNSSAVDVSIIDNDTCAVLNLPCINVDNSYAWLLKAPKAHKNIEILTGSRLGNKMINVSFFPELERAGIRNIKKFKPLLSDSKFRLTNFIL